VPLANKQFARRETAAPSASGASAPKLVPTRRDGSALAALLRLAPRPAKRQGTVSGGVPSAADGVAHALLDVTALGRAAQLLSVADVLQAVAASFSHLPIKT